MAQSLPGFTLAGEQWTYNPGDGGAVITASHNPKEWNGVKMVRRGALALSGDAGIK